MTDQQHKDNQTWSGRFSTIVKYLRHYRGYLVVGAICIVFSNALMMVLPYLTKLVFDELEQGGVHTRRLQLVLIMIGLAILSGAFRFLTRRTVIWMSRWLEADLRSDLFGHLLGLSPRFFDNTRTGDLMVRLTSDIEAVRMMIGPGIMHVTNTIVTFVVAVSFMLYLDPVLTVYALIPMAAIPFVVNRVGNLVHVRAQKVQEHFSELTATVQENIAGVRVVKAFRQESAEVEHFGIMSMKYFRVNMDLARVNALFHPLLLFFASLLVMCVLYFGGREVMQGRMPLGSLVAFFAYLSMLFWPAIALGWVISLYQRGTASLDRINRILRLRPDIPMDTRHHRGPVSGGINFCGLSFAYDDRTVLHNVNLTITPGQTVGIIGRTGCGKTTLVSLLAGFYPVTRGQLQIDGIDINDWDLGALRRRISFAPQEPFLFSDTIAQNVRFGAAEATPDDVERAAVVASLDKDLPDFPDGYQTMVGERGITLSGGQKQRTTIARAIVTDPAILVLDDATSAVDTETEAEINERIKAVLTDRTAIIISHRASAVKDADLIISMEAGRIVEQGSHYELLRNGGYYAELYRSQLLQQELDRL
ncbi:MAG: ABC transporter ATP-binding protein [bacterium]